MNYLIAVLPDRFKAEEAYTALEKAGIPLSKMAIAGRGYKTADELGLYDPKQQAREKSQVHGILAGYLLALSVDMYLTRSRA